MIKKSSGYYVIGREALKREGSREVARAIAKVLGPKVELSHSGNSRGDSWQINGQPIADAPYGTTARTNTYGSAGGDTLVDFLRLAGYSPREEDGKTVYVRNW